MRILHVGSTLELSGGIESFIMNLYKNTCDKEFIFDFLVTEVQKSGHYRSVVLQNGGKINVIEEDCVTWKILKEKYRIYKQYGNEIVHIHTNCGSRVFDALLAKMAGVKHVILHFHTCMGNPPLKFRVLRPFFRLLGDYFWACSDDAAGYFLGEVILKNKNYNLIHNAISVENYRYDENVRESLRDKHNWNGYFIVGYVGRLSIEKNITFLIEIIKEMKNVHDKVKLVIIGNGELEDSLNEFVNSNSLNDYVEMIGAKENVNEYLSAFDCFVLPSLYEGLGIVLIEAQASGLPCVASDSIPLETKVTSLIEYLPLSKTAKYWADIIYSKGNIRDASANDIVCASGYNIKKECERIKKLYSDIYNS